MCFYTLFSGVAVGEEKHLHRSEEQRKLFREILEGRRLELSLKVPLNERSVHLTEVVQKFGGGPAADRTTTKLLTNGDQTFSEILQSSKQNIIYIFNTIFINLMRLVQKFGMR